VPLSTEQVSEDAFAAVNEKAAEVDEVVEVGPERMFTVGGGGGAIAAAVTVQVTVALADPLAFATRTANT
jgi:hypothetical protein